VEEDLRRSVGHYGVSCFGYGWDPGDVAEVSASKSIIEMLVK